MGRMILIPGANYSSANFGKVTPSDELPIEAITINGPGAAYGYADYTAKLWPTFTHQRDYTWSIVSGDTYATINATTGRLTVIEGASETPVTIRCTSTANPNVYSDRTILCSSGELVYYDYLESDGSAYILIDRFSSLTDATVTTLYTTGSTANGYMLSNLAQDSLNAANIYALYLQSNGNTSRVAPGTKGASNITTSNATRRKYRAVLQLSSTTTLSDGVFTCYDASTSDQLVKFESFTCYLASYFILFALGYASTIYETPTIKPDTNATGKFYGMTIVKSGETIADYRPCTIDGTPCIIDYISGLTYYNEAESGLTAGND